MPQPSKCTHGVDLNQDCRDCEMESMDRVKSKGHVEDDHNLDLEDDIDELEDQFDEEDDDLDLEEDEESDDSDFEPPSKNKNEDED